MPISLPKTIKKIVLAVLCVIVPNSYANAFFGHFYVSGDIGASLGKLNRSNPSISYDNGNLIDQYPLNNTHVTTGMAGLAGGYVFTESHNAMPGIAVGLGIYNTLPHYNYNGSVNEIPTGALYNYQYEIMSTRLMAETKLTFAMHKVISFIDFGIGSAWNQQTGYHETSITPNGYVTTAPFQSNTTTHAAYQVGLGLGYLFNFKKTADNIQHEGFSVGYRYVSLGSASFGTRGASYPYALTLGNLTANEFYAGYTHIF